MKTVCYRDVFFWAQKNQNACEILGPPQAAPVPNGFRLAIAPVDGGI
ncbi:MAG: hypothetical protein AAGI38_21580 [Bacteroidota bacterium]